jgi:hypothetical protein
MFLWMLACGLEPSPDLASRLASQERLAVDTPPLHSQYSSDL